MTGDIGSAVVSDPCPPGTDAHTEFNTTRRCLDGGSAMGRANLDIAFVTCRNIGFSLSNFDRPTARVAHVLGRPSEMEGCVAI
jgi:hypothetical protein